jgi:hypothetical protein
MAFKMSGLNKLSRELTEAQKALDGLDGLNGIVNFNADDPASIELAVSSMEQIIDQRVGRYATNRLIGPMAEKMKASYRRAILDQAAEARIKGDG